MSGQTATQDGKPLAGTGTGSVKGLAALFTAFGVEAARADKGSAPRLTQEKSPQTKVLETLHAELVRVDNALVTGTRPQKPAVLAGMFRYAESAVSGTEKRLANLSGGEGSGMSKKVVETKAKETANSLASAKAKQVALSLGELERVVGEFEAKVKTLGTEALALRKLGPEEAAKARGHLYQEASEVLNEVVREAADWGGQIAEAADFIVAQGTKFRDGLAKLGKFETILNTVVDGCLPQLVSRPLRPGEQAPEGRGGPEVPKILDPAKALVECGNTWVAAKQKYGANKDEMQKLADYRKKEVDAWLNTNMPGWGLEYGPGKGWVSVGSSDPTSDYDISVNKHGKDGDKPKYDYVIVTEFNAWFRGRFKGEGGTVFDTNLYASAPPMVTDPNPSGVATNDVAALMKMRRYMTPGEFEQFRIETVEACGEDFDQAMKVEQQFAMADNNYRIVIVSLLENGKAVLEKRIAEREERAKTTPLNEEEQHTHSLEKAGLWDIENWLAKGRKASSGIESYGLIEEGEEYSRVLDHLLKDSSLQTTNEVYTAKIGEVRGAEQAIVLLKELGATLEKDFTGKLGELANALKEAAKGLNDLGVEGGHVGAALNGAVVALEGGNEDDIEGAVSNLGKVVASETGMRLEQLGNLAVISRYFANEAYQSGGPFEHVVTATQAAEADATNETVEKAVAGKLSPQDRQGEGGKMLDPKVQVAMAKAGSKTAYNEASEEQRKKWQKEAQDEIDLAVKAEKKKRQDLLPPSQCLESFNEQLGDFLKDLEHYAEDEPGKAIIQSSKYLERLLDATRLMMDKEMFAGAGDITGEIEAQLALQARVKNELIAARKGNLVLVANEGEGGIDQQEQRRAYACDFMKKLGVSSIAALSKKYTGFGVKVNAAARKYLASQS
jgi:hypothetical protein